ncbi:MAG: hypothetical protein AB1509_16275 [Chloroflexota bacterium]
MTKKDTPRRNPLAAPPSDEQSSMWRQVLSQIGDPERVEAAMQKKAAERKREWEKAHPSRCYRGVPADIRQQVKEIAETLGVPADEVARAFFEYSLVCLNRGTLTLAGVPSQRRVRMTLYASGAGWAENGWKPEPAKRGRKDKPAALWREAVYYRIPDELHERIKQAADDVYPTGEVAAVLLKHGIESYQNGTLVLMPQPKLPANLGWAGGKR